MGVARDVERISPSHRIKVGWLETCDYLVYPVEAALTDQLCGIVETHGGKGILHKVNDFVDIAVYATTAEADGSGFRSRLRCNAAVQHISLGDYSGLPKAYGNRIRDRRQVPRPRAHGRGGRQTLESGSAGGRRRRVPRWSV